MFRNLSKVTNVDGRVRHYDSDCAPPKFYVLKFPMITLGTVISNVVKMRSL